VLRTTLARRYGLKLLYINDLSVRLGAAFDTSQSV